MESIIILLKIGNEECQYRNIEERWIAQQLNKRNGRPVCIELVIRQGDVSLPLKSGACSNTGSSGGGRRPNRKEFQLLKLWDEMGLNNTDIKPGKLIKFLDKYERYI